MLMKKFIEKDEKAMERTILHCDMNNFYASVECFLNPDLKPYPVAVCGSVEERHGIVLAKNYKAKACGVTTGEAVWQAQQKCRDLVIVPPHYEEYMKFSKAARKIYEDYTDQVEAFGMDECWLDVTGSVGIYGDGEKIAQEIRERIKFELGLTVSIGVSFNKIFAKLGSDLKKPDAVTCIPKERFKEIVWPLAASEMLGVGRATEKKLAACGVRTIGTLATWPVEFFEKKFGKFGVALWLFANGLDESRVAAADASVPVKSVGHGTTALQDLENAAEVWRIMLALTQEIGHKLYTYEKRACGVQIDVRDNKLFTKQWQCPLPHPTQSASEIAKTAFELFCRSYEWRNPIRSVTVRAINLTAQNTPYQLDLFCDPLHTEKTEKIDRTVEDLRLRFGMDIIRNACLLDNPKMPSGSGPQVIMPTGVPT